MFVHFELQSRSDEMGCSELDNSIISLVVHLPMYLRSVRGARAAYASQIRITMARETSCCHGGVHLSAIVQSIQTCGNPQLFNMRRKGCTV